MNITALDTLTDSLAKTNSTMFPVAEKLLYYNVAKGILNSRIIRQQGDTNEEEYLDDTVAGQNDYETPSRIHHINWLKVNYGDGFVPARYRSEAELIARYGTELEGVLASWPKSDPIYNFKGKHLFVYPAASAEEAGEDRLWSSLELLPPDLDGGNDTPSEIPDNFHYLLAVYAAWMYHKNNGEDALATSKEKDWLTGIITMLDTMFPRAREEELIAGVPDTDGSEF